jgi:hypothetical protein
MRADLTSILKILETDAQTNSARTTTFRTGTATVTGATRHDSKQVPLSAGASAVGLDLSPITGSAPGQFLWLTADQPLGLRLNDPSATLMSGVYQLMLAVSALSSLFLTPPASADATVRLEVGGGGTVHVSPPLA